MASALLACLAPLSVLVAEAARSHDVEGALATEAGRSRWKDFDGRQVVVEMGDAARWEGSGAGLADEPDDPQRNSTASACGISFQYISTRDFEGDGEMWAPSADFHAGWYVVGADGRAAADEGGAAPCEFGTHGQPTPVVVGMRLEGRPGDKEFTLSYIPPVFHFDETKEPRELDVGYVFPDEVQGCEAERAGVYCFGAPAPHCVTWVYWKAPCAFKTAFDLLPLASSLEETARPGGSGRRAARFDEQVDRLKMEWKANMLAGVETTGFRAKSYKPDKKEEKNVTAAHWNKPVVDAQPGITLFDILHHVYFFARARGWYAKFTNNCQMFAAWLLSEITVAPAFWPLFNPMKGVPLLLPKPGEAGRNETEPAWGGSEGGA